MGPALASQASIRTTVAALLALGAVEGRALAAAAPAATLNRSAERIKHWIARTPDGASWSLGYAFDTKFQTGCQSRIAADGKTRCLPMATLVAGSDYADAQCTIPVVSGRTIPASRAPGEYVSLLSPPLFPEKRYALRPVDPVAIRGPTRVYQLGDAHSGPVFRLGPDRSCKAFNNGYWADCFKVGPEIPPGEFLEAEVAVEPALDPGCPTCCLNQSGQRVRLESMRTADGASTLSSFSLTETPLLRDANLGLPCRAAPDREGEWRCFPLERSYGDLFSDSTCSQAVAQFFPHSPLRAEPQESPKRVIAMKHRPTSRDEEPPRLVFEVLDDYAGPVFRRAQDGGCSRADMLRCTEPTPPSYKRLGAELPASDYAQMVAPSFENSKPGKQCLVDPFTKSGSRLRFKVTRSPDGAAAVQGPFDSRYGAVCFLGKTADGKLRTLPSRGDVRQTGEFFSDQACSKRLYQSWGAPLAPFAAVIDVSCPKGASEACPVGQAAQRQHLFRIEGRYTGSAFKRERDGRCEPLPTSRAGGADFFTLGPEAAPRDFVEVTLSLE